MPNETRKNCQCKKWEIHVSREFCHECAAKKAGATRWLVTWYEYPAAARRNESGYMVNDEGDEITPDEWIEKELEAPTKSKAVAAARKHLAANFARLPYYEAKLEHQIFELDSDSEYWEFPAYEWTESDDYDALNVTLTAAQIARLQTS